MCGGMCVSVCGTRNGRCVCVAGHQSAVHSPVSQSTRPRWSRHALGGQLPDPHMRDSNERGRAEGEVGRTQKLTVAEATARRPPQTIPIPPPIPSHPRSPSPRAPILTPPAREAT